jgi:hypothetical protein
MFSHLKAEDFVNLMEGAALSARHRSHIDSCPRCRTTWESMRSVHAEFTSLEADIPEPDWGQFRSSVRDELLSRSIQRQTAVRRWTGWSIRPVMAWALSLFMAVGITTVTVLWRAQHHEPVLGSVTIETVPTEAAPDMIEAGPERSLFDDLVSLGDEEQEQFRQMLESSQKGISSQR